MTEQGILWLVLIGCGLVTFVYRIVPALVPRIRHASSDAAWLRFFDYASYAVIGGIVTSNLLSAAGGRTGGDALAAVMFSAPFLSGLCGVAVSFVVSVTTGRQVAAIIAGLAVFQGLHWVWP